jgi:hypothetical protein
MHSPAASRNFLAINMIFVAMLSPANILPEATMNLAQKIDLLRARAETNTRTT